MALIPFHSKNLPFFHFFFHLLTNRETTNILDLLSLLGEFPLNPVGRMFILGPLVHLNASIVILSLGVWSIPLLNVSVVSSAWKVKIFIKVKFFVWQFLHERVTTLAKGSVVVESSCCILCRR